MGKLDIVFFSSLKDESLLKKKVLRLQWEK